MRPDINVLGISQTEDGVYDIDRWLKFMVISSLKIVWQFFKKIGKIIIKERLEETTRRKKIKE